MSACDAFHQELERSIEERTEFAAHFAQHFQCCSAEACHTAYLEYQLLAEVIPAWKASLPAAELVSRVLVQVAAQHDPIAKDPIASRRTPGTQSRVTSTQPHPVSASRSSIATVAIFGPLSLCLLLMVQALSNPENAVAVLDSPEILPIPNSDPPVPETNVEDELRALGKTYGHWVQGATQRLTDTVAVVLLEEQSPSSESLPNWFSSLAEKIEPIETKLDATLNFLLNPGPGDLDDQTSLPDLENSVDFAESMQAGRSLRNEHKQQTSLCGNRHTSRLLLIDGGADFAV